MTEDNVLSALDAFIVTFKPDPPEPKSHRSQSHERNTYSDSDIKKERGEREREEGSRVESYINNNGSFGPTTTTPAFPPVFRGQSRASRATREMRWHLARGERVPRHLCAGCRRPITPLQKALDLVDDNRVHLADGYECLIRHGDRWRRAAREAIAWFESGS